MPSVAAMEKPSALKAPGHLEAGRLVPVGQREEHRARVGQPGARRHLALGEGEAEGDVDAHDLAGRAHLGAEQRVDPGEAVEGQHRLLDAHVVEHAHPADRVGGQQPLARAARPASGRP